MKKKLLSILSLLFSLSAFCQKLPIPKFQLNANKGTVLNSITNGQVIYAQKDSKKAVKSDMDIPEELAAGGVIIISYKDTYYFQGKKITKNFQLIYSNISPDSKFSKASEKNPINVNNGERLGIANGIPSVVIRDLDLDPYLTECSKSVALNVGAYWYFDLSSYMNEVPKFLSFQPIESKKDEIEFPDASIETLEQILENRKNKGIQPLPALPVKIKTVMNQNPKTKPEMDQNIEKAIHLQYMNGMNLEVSVKFLGYTFHIYFPDNFQKYFEDEYKLGDKIWFYGNILYVKDGEFYLYGRDFVLEDPDGKVNEKQNLYIKANRGSKPVQKDNSSDYVDVSMSVPKGGSIQYERFFTNYSNPDVFVENTSNIRELIYDKKGRLIASRFWYNETQMIRNTATYKYDDKDRVIEVCFYDSYMYNENGTWKVDEKRSRVFNKNVTVYNQTEDGYEEITKSYRYSYLPRVEHPQSITTKKYNKNGILIYHEVLDLESQQIQEINKYDDFGNLIYEKYITEKPYENKIEYVYDGEKILKSTVTSLLTKKITTYNFKYDEKDRLIERSSPEYNTTTFYLYDKKGRIIEEQYVNSKGDVSKLIYRYDKKTGRLVLKIEAGIDLKYSRFWYYESTNKNWEKDLNPWKLAEELGE